MSSQTIYFTNPTEISSLQYQVGTNAPALPTDSTSWDPYSTYLNQQRSSTVGNGRASNTTGAPTSGRDLYGTGAFGVLSIFGNIFTGQEIVLSTGTQDSAGTPINADSMMSVMSNSRMIGQMVAVKMMEEQYFTHATTISSLFPIFSGTGWAWADTTGSASKSYVGDPTTDPNWSFTGSMTPVALGSLTMAQAMGWNIHFPFISSAVTAPRNKQNSFTLPLSTSDWGIIYSGYQAQKALETGQALGATGACQLFSAAGGSSSSTFVMGTGALRNFYYNFMFNDTSFCTGPFTDHLTTAINCIKSGVVPMGFVPGTDAISQQNIYGPKIAYTYFSQLLLQAACAGALAQKQGQPGFPATGTYDLLSYTRAKILAPCGITPADSSFGACEGTASVTAPYMEMPWRRAYVQSTGWYGTTTNADPTYISKANALVWSSQYPNDGLSLQENYNRTVIRRDPLAPDFSSTFYITPRKYCNLLKMLCNKGIYNNTRVFTRSYYNMLSQTVIALGRNVFENLTGLADNFGPNYDYMLLGSSKMSSSNNVMADPLVNNIASAIPESSSLGTIGNANVTGFSTSTQFVTGINGTLAIFDTDTGNYMFCMLPQNGYGVVNNDLVVTNFNYLTRYI